MSKSDIFAQDGSLRRSVSFNRYSQTRRIARSRHTGEWIVEELNTVYGYWATIARRSDLTKVWIEKLLNRPTYLGPKHEAEIEHERNLGLCG
ncbi:MAG TPA: hypothetical protein VM531_03425 [Sphingomicrobium sp.]|nr:hypothetical protein [Sphingomicrobium sp.]